MSQTIFEVFEEWWKNTESLVHLSSFLIVYLTTCGFLYKICLRKSKEKNPNLPRRVLFFTAHPDDECMFFGPTIVSLLRNNCEVHLICFSRGGYDDDNEKIRQAELWEACKALGMSSSNITIYSDSTLPDSPSQRWSEKHLGDIILHHAEALEVNAVITFDREGVSGHLNHISLFYAIAYLGTSGKFPKNVKFYVLDSVNLFRKYWGFLDLPVSFIMSSNRFILSWKESQIVVSAMKKHRSQMLWFRRLYLLFSRYLLINTLKEVTPADLELELQLDD